MKEQRLFIVLCVLLVLSITLAWYISRSASGTLGI